LEQKLEQTRSKLDEAREPESLRLQGEIRALKRLMNLPQTLALIDQEDERVLEEERKKT